jgi:hypothetical protein
MSADMQTGMTGSSWMLFVSLDKISLFSFLCIDQDSKRGKNEATCLFSGY